jgi:photosystem II stability/assembly factor-like uncharacterized protein
MIKKTLALLLLAASTALLAQTQRPGESEKPDAEDPIFKDMHYRPIGPFRGGRSLTVSGIAGDPTTYWFGGVGGGVWKSNDGALTWSSVFDKEGTSSIGSLAVAPSDPHIVYVGTGEACLRGNISHGDGVYKTVDGGKTWKNTGMRDSRAIGKVIVHPRNSDIAFVAALGHPYGPNVERGVFRTLDGGKNWEKVLYKDENTGAVDVAFDPNNPNILFATLWQVRRTSYSLDSGGLGSGLYRSNDGGTTWKHLEGEGLPKAPWGRAGVVVAANSERIYALIQAEDGGLYRSDDGGEKWQLVNANRALRQRAWYYMHVIADPSSPEVLYILDVEFFKSTDGGRSFNHIKVPHGDNHALWIDPKNTQRMISGNDGGAIVTLDAGKHWSQPDNQPTAQFYHVITDNRFPYYVYGAQQDNSTIAIASRSDSGRIDKPEWYPVGGGEAGHIAPYPPDPNIVYAGDYEGVLTRFDKRTGQVKSVSPWPEISDGLGAAGLEHRFQWTAPLLISPHDPNTLYHAGEVLFKSTDGGQHWTVISKDLTRNDKSKQGVSGGSIDKDDTGTEYYDTIFAVAESPLAKGLIWTGADDGMVHVTRDGGGNWTDVTPKNMPEWSRISIIDASPHDAATAYMAVDRHQNDDLHPYIYKTSDYGKSWTLIVNGIPENTFARAVREDPKRRGLLYAGTETGIFISFNDGANWRPLKLNLPTTPVHDLVIKDDDLVVATHGRAFWILDDVSPLREFKDQEKSEVWLYKPATALRIHSSGRPARPVLAGENPPPGAVIYYHLKSVPKGDLIIDILDSGGKTIRHYSSARVIEPDEPLDPDAEKPKKEIEPHAGLNRFVWDLRYRESPRIPGYYLYEYNEGAKGPVALPGSYQVRLTVDGKTLTQPLELKLDPRVKIAPADLDAQFALLTRIQGALTRVYNTVLQMRDVRTQLADLQRRLPEDDSSKPVRDAAVSLDKKIVTALEDLIDLRIAANEDSLAFPLGLDGKLATLAMNVSSGADSAPTEPETRVFQKYSGQLDTSLSRWQSLVSKDIAEFQKLAAARGLGPVIVH